MNVSFSPKAWTDFIACQTEEPDVFEKIVKLIEDVRRDPFKGTGKPEPLKGPLSGCWSRRINQRDRLVYRVSGKDEIQQVYIISCRQHY